MLGIPQFDGGAHEETVYGRADYPESERGRASGQYPGGVPQAQPDIGIGVVNVGLPPSLSDESS